MVWPKHEQPLAKQLSRALLLLIASQRLQLGALAQERTVETRSPTCSLHATFTRANLPAWIWLSDASCGV